MDWTTEITKNDFKRELALPLSSTSLGDLKDYIKETVEDIMTDMLGVEAYAIFEAEYESSTPAQEWVDLWEGVIYDGDYGKHKFIGAKKACIQFIWCAFTNYVGNQIKVGRYQDEVSNSEKLDPFLDNTKNTIEYNKGVTIYTEAKELLFTDAYENIYYTKKNTRCL